MRVVKLAVTAGLAAALFAPAPANAAELDAARLACADLSAQLSGNDPKQAGMVLLVAVGHYLAGKPDQKFDPARLPRIAEDLAAHCADPQHGEQLLDEALAAVMRR
jgi:hypothetical protein